MPNELDCTCKSEKRAEGNAEATLTVDAFRPIPDLQANLESQAYQQAFKDWEAADAKFTCKAPCSKLSSGQFDHLPFQVFPVKVGLPNGKVNVSLTYAATVHWTLWVGCTKKPPEKIGALHGHNGGGE